MTDTRARARATKPVPSSRPATANSDDSRPPAGFQPAGRRRNRIAFGVLLAAIAVGGNAWVYSGVNARDPAVQVTRDVPAGALITADMLRTVEIDTDSTVNVVAGDRLDTVIGTYARVRLVSGSLLTAEALQATPLVADGSAIVAIQVAEGTLPQGLRERVPVVLVVPNADEPPMTVNGRVVGLPQATDSALGVESLSVEVALVDAATIAAADDVRVVLLEPSADPADAPVAAPDDDPTVPDPTDGDGDS